MLPGDCPRALRFGYPLSLEAVGVTARHYRKLSVTIKAKYNWSRNNHEKEVAIGFRYWRPGGRGDWVGARSDARRSLPGALTTRSTT